MNRLALSGIVSVGALAVAGLLGLFVFGRSGAADLASAVTVSRPPRIRPDYSGVVIPPNIASLNFLVEEPGTDYRVRIRADQGPAIDVATHDASVVIPLSRWQSLLSANRGGQLHFEVCVRGPDGQWTRFEPIVNTIADADIDRYLCYRLIKPIYIVRVNVALYQRDVQTYDETVVVSNQSFRRGGGCVNCHTFAPHQPDQMLLHSRGSAELSDLSGMIVVRQGRVSKLDSSALVRTPESDRGRVKKSLAGYAAWHPSGRLAAFVAGDMMQFFHAVGEPRDVFNRESDLALYHADSNTVTTVPQISQPDRVETFPTWSPDGRTLYFCSTAPLPVARHREVRYDLMRISYDPDSQRWGEVEPVLLAKDTGLSIVEPRVSPDGRWLLCCMSEYGEFPAFQPSSDLYLMDLTTRRYARLDINSPRAESWHCWSSNSRWIAFASKRVDGTFARLYFSYVDDQGRAHKPVLLPQRDPTFYDRFLKTYNVPELTPTPVPVTERDLVEAICQRDVMMDAKPPDMNDQVQE
jgi:hypothetical protein